MGASEKVRVISLGCTVKVCPAMGLVESSSVWAKALGLEIEIIAKTRAIFARNFNIRITQVYLVVLPGEPLASG